MKIAVFQFQGCKKCFHETLLLQAHKSHQVTWIEDPAHWKSESIDIAIITGYLLPSDRDLILKVTKNIHQIIGFGNCPISGGIFGLGYQKGYKFLPIKKLIPNTVELFGCLGDVDELLEILEKKDHDKLKPLCNICGRSSQPKYLEHVTRFLDPQGDPHACFNDQGFLCNGYIARHCKEMCVSYGAPCRGCKPSIDRSGIRMIGMFGSLMGQIEVATEATGKGGTDKLADRDDDITAGVPDVTGNFFRFDLTTSTLPLGRQPSSGVLLHDVMKGRLLEELPLLLGCIGGSKAISLTLHALQAYEKVPENELSISEITQTLRNKLLEFEKQLQSAIQSRKSSTYQSVTQGIRSIAGNMNLSNLFYGGFRTPIQGYDGFDQYRAKTFDFHAGTYSDGPIRYSIDDNGIITDFFLST